MLLFAEFGLVGTSILVPWTIPDEPFGTFPPRKRPIYSELFREDTIADFPFWGLPVDSWVPYLAIVGLPKAPLSKKAEDFVRLSAYRLRSLPERRRPLLVLAIHRRA
jgi:hypothetical protein